LRVKGMDKFLKELNKAADGGLKREMALWLEGIGMEFLDIVQDEIIRTKTVDTRRLLNSFTRGDADGVWELKSGGLILHVGTNLNYASYANDGRHQNKRFVPGYWKGDRFVYEPGANTGMMLKERWVEGSHYWDNALVIFEKMFTKSLEKKVQNWLNTTFEG